MMSLRKRTIKKEEDYRRCEMEVVILGAITLFAVVFEQNVVKRYL